jgi:hypothetical protein
MRASGLSIAPPASATARVFERRYHFVTVLEHVDPRVERAVEEHVGFAVVEKIGEAREALDREHPQQGHNS